MKIMRKENRVVTSTDRENSRGAVRASWNPRCRSKYKKSPIKAASSNGNEYYVAFTNAEDDLAHGNTLDECINNLLRVCSLDDIIEWDVYIDKYIDGDWVESFKSTDVYDFASPFDSQIHDHKVTSSTKSKKKTPIKASTDNKADVIAILEDNGFESAGIDEPWWDKNMWLGFGCTYDMDREDAYVWWNPDGSVVELPYEYSVKTVRDANALCDDLYAWDEYDLGDLLAAGLPLKGAKKIDNDVYEYSDGGETAYIDIYNYNGYIIDAYGDRTDYSSLQDLLEEIGIIR